MTLPFRILDDAQALAATKGWDAGVCEDFLGLRRRTLSEQAFTDKYRWRTAILSIDLTGFTNTAIRWGEILSLLRILDVQRVAIPVLQDAGATLIRCFADDIVALFDDAGTAVDAALEIHRRVDIFNASGLATEHPARCCAGIGFGDVFRIGPNLAQGDEMNRASKLGEDIARGEETLITEQACEQIVHRDDLRFDRQETDDLLFPFYRVSKTGEG